MCSRIMSDANYLDAGADGRVYDALALVDRQRRWHPDRRLRTGFRSSSSVMCGSSRASIQSSATATSPLTAVQSILGAAACRPGLRGSRANCSGAHRRRVAALFTALSFSLIFAAATLGHQAVDVFLTALIVWLLVRFDHDPARAPGAGPWPALVVGLGVCGEGNEYLPGRFRAAVDRVRESEGLAGVGSGARGVCRRERRSSCCRFSRRRCGRRGSPGACGIHFDRLYRGEGGSRPCLATELVAPLTDPQRGLDADSSTSPGVSSARLARAYAKNFAVQFLTQPVRRVRPGVSCARARSITTGCGSTRMR